MQEQPLINELTDSSNWSRWFDTLTNWMVDHVFNTQTLLELGLILIAAALAWPIAGLGRGTKPSFTPYSQLNWRQLPTWSATSSSRCAPVSRALHVAA